MTPDDAEHRKEEAIGVRNSNVDALKANGVDVPGLEACGFTPITSQGDVRIMPTGDRKRGFLLVQKIEDKHGWPQDSSELSNAKRFLVQGGRVTKDRIEWVNPEKGGKTGHWDLVTSDGSRSSFDTRGKAVGNILVNGNEGTEVFDYYGRRIVRAPIPELSTERNPLSSIELL